MKLFLDNSENTDWENLPEIVESVRPGESSSEIALRTEQSFPAWGTARWETDSGRAEWRGLRVGRRVVVGATRTVTLPCFGHDWLLRTTALFGRWEGRAYDVLGNLLAASTLDRWFAAATSLDDRVVVDCRTGRKLDEALNDLVGQVVGALWFVSAVGNLFVGRRSELGRLPFDLNPDLDCGQELESLEYGIDEGDRTNRVWVFGKNAQARLFGRTIPQRIEVLKYDIPPSSPGRHYPVIPYATSILRVRMIARVAGVLWVEPISVLRYDGSSAPAEFTAHLAGFGADMRVLALGLGGVDWSFDPQPVAGGTGNTAALGAVADGTWTDSDTTEEGQIRFYVHTDGATAQADEFDVLDNSSLEGVEFAVRGTTFQLTALPSAPGDVEIGATDSDTETNMEAAINAAADQTLATALVTGGKVRVTSRVPGLGFEATSSAPAALGVGTVTANSGTAQPQSRVVDLRVLDNDLVGVTLTVGGADYEFAGAPGAGIIVVEATADETEDAILARINADAATTGFRAVRVGDWIRMTNQTPGVDSTVATSDPAKIEISTRGEAASAITIEPCTSCDVIYNEPANPDNNSCWTEPTLGWELRYAPDCAGHENELIDSGTRDFAPCEGSECGSSPAFTITWTDFCGVERSIEVNPYECPSG